MSHQRDPLHQRLHQRQQEVAQLEHDCDALRRAIRTSERRRADLLDLLGLDAHDQPLRLAPLIWALVGAVAALTACFLTYLSGLLALQYSRPDSDTWVAVAFTLGSATLAGLSQIWSRRPGAGGSARATLRTMIWVLGATSLAGLLLVGVLYGIVR